MANEGEVIAIVSADISPYQAKLKEAKRLAQQFEKEMRGRKVSISLDTKAFQTDMRKASKTIDDFQKKMAKISQSRSSQTGLASNLKKDLRELGKLTPVLSTLAPRLENIKTQLKPLSDGFGLLATRLNSVANVSKRVSIDFREIQKAITGLNTAMNANAAAIMKNNTAINAFANSQRKAANAAKQSGTALDGLAKKQRRTQKENKNSQESASKFDQALEALGESAAFITGPLGGIASRVAIVKRSFSAGTVALTGFAVAATAAGVAMIGAIREAQKFETSQLRIQAQLNATGYAAGVTREEIIQFSRELGAATLGDPLEIQEAATRLLAFRGISREVFFDVLKSSQDLAELGFGSVKTASIQLASALQDPESGISRLEKANIRLDPAVKDTIKSLFELGDRLAAQKLLLSEVQKRTQGVAQGTAVGLAGAFDSAGQATSEFLQTLAKRSGALGETTKLVNEFAKAVNSLTEAIGGLPVKDEKDPISLLVERQAKILKTLSSQTLKAGGVVEENLKKSLDKIEKELSSRQLEFDIFVQEQDLNKALEERARISRKIRQEGNTPELQKQYDLAQKLVEFKAQNLRDAISQVPNERAIAQEKSEQAQAEQDAAAAAEEARLAREAEANRLKTIRQVSLRSLAEENEILRRTSKLNIDNFETLDDYAKAQEAISREVRLGFNERQKTVAQLQAELRLAEAQGDAVKRASIVRQIAAAKDLETLRAQVRLNEKLVQAEQERMAIASARAADREANDDLEFQLKGQHALLEASRVYEIENGKIQRHAVDVTEDRIETETRLRARLNDFKKAGKDLTAQEIQAERELISIQVAKERQIKQVGDRIEETRDAQEEALERQKEFQETLSSGLTDLIYTTGSFEDALKKLVLELSKAAVEARLLAAIQYSAGTGTGEVPGGASGNVTGGLIDLFKAGAKSYFGGGSSAAGVPENAVQSAIPEASAFIAHQGGIVGNITSRRSVPASNFISAPRFHDGLRQNEFPAILEKGEEVIPKDKVGAAPPTRPNITFNINTPDADSFRASERQMARKLRMRASQ